MYTLCGILMMILGIILCTYKVKDKSCEQANMVYGTALILLGIAMFYYGTSVLLDEVFKLIR